MTIKSTSIKQFTMKQDYDGLADSLFLHSNEDYKYKKSVRLTDDIILDFDENDMPVALELLNASKILNVKKSSLTDPIGLDLHISVDINTIKLDGFFYINHNKEISKSLNEKTPNHSHLATGGAYFATAAA